MINITTDSGNGQSYFVKTGEDPIFLSGGLGDWIKATLDNGENTNHLDSRFRSPLHAPAVLLDGHNAFLSEGAEIITTDTFRAFQTPGKEAEILKKAFKIAQEGIGHDKHSRAIAISLGPMGDTDDPTLTPTDSELYKAHTQNVALIADQIGEATEHQSFLLAETLPTLREAEAIAELAQASDIPFITSFNVTPDGLLRDGSSMEDVVDTILTPHSSCLGISVNCCSVEGAQKAVEALRQIYDGSAELIGKQIGAYPNGYRDTVEKNKEKGCCGTESSIYTPIELSGALWDLAARGATMIGGCCGAMPEHTAAYTSKAHEQGAASLLHGAIKPQEQSGYPNLAINN